MIPELTWTNFYRCENVLRGFIKLLSTKNTDIIVIAGP